MDTEDSCGDYNDENDEDNVPLAILKSEGIDCTVYICIVG